jgi:AcrR family transcriptional regulator
MVEAAYRLFAERGYGVSLEAIAELAGVAVQTLYFTFHTKTELLKEVIAFGSAGSADGLPVPERSWFIELGSVTSAHRVIALTVEQGVDIFHRLAPLIPAIQSAAFLDAEFDGYWGAVVASRRRGMRHIMQMLAEKSWLREGMSVANAADIFFVVQSPQTLLSFTQTCGWTLEQYKAWLYTTLCQQLLARNATDDHTEDPLANLSFETTLTLRKA